MDKNKLKNQVKETIYPNGLGKINATNHQALLLDIVEAVYENGEGKADADGNYPKMHVGYANDLAGHGESTLEEFTFRASGGKSIKDGSATIKELQGNAVVVDGAIIPFRGDAIKSVGDNAFDASHAIAGYMDDVTGVFTPSSDSLYSAFLIKCIAGEQYYFRNVLNGYYKASVYYYGESMNYLGYNYVSTGNGFDSSGIIETPLNVHYMRVLCHKDFLDSCMVTLVHSGWKQDTDAGYQPYWADTLQIDSRIKDAFPNGMMPWDKVYNKDGKGYIVKGTGMVEDMATLNWGEGFGGFISSGLVELLARPTSYEQTSLLCPVLPTTLEGKGISVVYGGTSDYPYNGYLNIKGYADVDSMLADIAGVPLYYERAIPEIIEFDKAFDLTYQVADFGTEELLSEQPTAPFRAKTIYQFNAVDQIRDNAARIAQLEAMIATISAHLTKE